MTAIRRSLWALLLPLFVLGGMYAGFFTATEAAAVGALLALFVASVIYRTRLTAIWASAIDASRTSAMLFMILSGAGVLGHVLTKMRIPQHVQSVVGGRHRRRRFLIAMMLLIFVLGMFLESISIILITTPIVLPVMHALHIDPIWYGILLTINLELAMITPPVGMNLFTIKAITQRADGQDHPRLGAVCAADDRGDGAGDGLAGDCAVAALDDDRPALRFGRALHLCAGPAAVRAQLAGGAPPPQRCAGRPMMTVSFAAWSQGLRRSRLGPRAGVRGRRSTGSSATHTGSSRPDDRNLSFSGRPHRSDGRCLTATRRHSRNWPKADAERSGEHKMPHKAVEFAGLTAAGPASLSLVAQMAALLARRCMSSRRAATTMDRCGVRSR